ncbi:MAG TPA: integrase core domain-containing protein [Chloroflexota bacterium]|nr:integrase core domain-containing protein [Chloroflexota bacterium]
MCTLLVGRLLAASRTTAQALRRRLLAATRPATAPLMTGTLADLARSKRELIAENALLRQQLVILRRSVKRPRCTSTDRTLLVMLASRLHTWRQSLLIVQPDTLLHWHRELFRRFWHRKSRTAAPAHRPPLAPETIRLIREMAAANRAWGAEHIRGELLKLHIPVAKWTIQKYMRDARPPRRSDQTWATFLRNHAEDIWARDFLPVTDLLFRPIYAFFVVELASRRVVQVGVTRHPTAFWVAQQLREATPFGQHPKYLILDNDSKYGSAFSRVAVTTGMKEVRTAYRAPKENAIVERFLGSVRRECLDHLLVLGEDHLRRILTEYVVFFNSARPHQGLQQRIPDPPAEEILGSGPVSATPVLGGLHHTYGRAA